MKHLTHLPRCAWALALALTACMPLNTPQPTPPLPEATVTPTATETTLPTETSTALPTETPTATPEPQLWMVWFWGFSCETSTECRPSPGPNNEGFYSILSDGSDLTRLEISELPRFSLPDWVSLAPEEVVLYNGFYRPDKKIGYVSPDERWVAYITLPHKSSPLQRLYVANLTDQTTTLLFETPALPEVEWWGLGAVCWGADSEHIHFIALKNSDLLPMIYRVRLGQADYEQVYTIPELDGVVMGACSPDGQEMILAQDTAYYDKYQQGLYRFNLVTGHLAQILSPFYISTGFGIAAAPTEFQP